MRGKDDVSGFTGGILDIGWEDGIFGRVWEVYWLIGGGKKGVISAVCSNPGVWINYNKLFIIAIQRYASQISPV